MSKKMLSVLILFILISLTNVSSEKLGGESLAPGADDLNETRLGKQIYIKEGDYYVGSDAVKDEKPLRLMHFKPFNIDIHPVTNKQYADFLKKSNYKTEGPFDGNEANTNPYFPAGNITLNDAIAYAEFYKMRLPTEWEWEIAARSLKKENAYSWGDALKADQCNWLEDVRNPKGLISVFKYPANELGLYDTAGNAFEWTSSLYPSNFLLGKNFSRFSIMVIRGGAWTNLVNDIRVSSRTPFPSTHYLLWLGFRCAKDAQ